MQSQCSHRHTPSNESRVSPLHENAPIHDEQQENLPPNAGPDWEQRILDTQDRWDTKVGKPSWKERQALLQSQKEEQNQRQLLIDQGLARDLQHHSLSLGLIFLFAFFAILSWAVTCILCYRPIGASSYYEQTKENNLIADWKTSDRWRRLAKVVSAIVGSISIPVTSAICAKAAAVYCLRRSDVRRPSLTLRQTLALADKGWSDLAVLRDVFKLKTGHQTRSPLLVASFCLVGLALLIPALQSAYVTTVHIKVSSFDIETTQLGFQVSPADLSIISSIPVYNYVINALVEGKFSDKQPYLWSNRADNLNITSVASNIGANVTDFGHLPENIFISTFPVGTDSGLVRQVALRLNSSLSCNTVAQTNFPPSCAGQNPFSQRYTNIDNSSDLNPFDPVKTSETNPPKFAIRTCAPGDIARSPWREGGKRQDIFEEFWLDVQYTPLQDTPSSNFTQYCHGNSTLGYFELPNYWNGHQAGGLFDELPDTDGKNVSYYQLDELFLGGPPPDFVGNHQVPGPLMTSVLAVFGNNTFFNTVASYSNYSSSNAALCQQLRFPFTGLYDDGIINVNNAGSSWWGQDSPEISCDSTNRDDTFLNALFQWLPNFGVPLKATAALTLANYYSNNALLNLGTGGGGAVPLVYDPGMDMQKFAMPLPAMIVISILLAMQLIGLAILAIYASRHNTWTESLDSFAMLRLGASIAENVPMISSSKSKEAKTLDEMAGWIGDAGGEGPGIGRLALGGAQGVKEEKLYQIISGGERDI